MVYFGVGVLGGGLVVSLTTMAIGFIKLYLEEKKEELW